MTFDKCQWVCIVHVIQAIYRNKDGHLQSWARIDLYGRLPNFRLLTHWSPGNFNSVFLLVQISHFMDAYISWISWLCPQKATEHIWWLVYTSSRYDLVSLGSNPLPEPMLASLGHTCLLSSPRDDIVVCAIIWYMYIASMNHIHQSHLRGAMTAWLPWHLPCVVVCDKIFFFFSFCNHSQFRLSNWYCHLSQCAQFLSFSQIVNIDSMSSDVTKSGKHCFLWIPHNFAGASFTDMDK